MAYFTISEPKNAIFREKGSKFIALIDTVRSKEELDIKLKLIRSKYPDATHHCYAARLNPIQLVEIHNDDGEPNGTAGLPILNALRSVNLVDVLIVVVRYFGGTKLGKGGLISSYSESSKVVIDESHKIELMMYTEFELDFNYDQTNLIETGLNTFHGKFSSTDYNEIVQSVIRVPKDFSDQFENYIGDLVWTGIRFKKIGDLMDFKS
ncbi:MAG TPA: hypothetical protein DCE78_01940 [Bacteroidetes bacterium]|nr:hypothetical protein [Bacteroidota bacterium]